MPETNLNQRIWTNESEEMKLKKQLQRSSLQTNLNKTRYAKSEKKSVSEVCRSPPRRPDGWRGPVGSQNDEARNQWHTGLIYSARVATYASDAKVIQWMAVRTEKSFVSLLATQSLPLAHHHTLIIRYQHHLMQTALAKWANSFGNHGQTVLAKWHYQQIGKGNIYQVGRAIHLFCSSGMDILLSISVKTSVPRKPQKEQVSNA